MSLGSELDSRIRRYSTRFVERDQYVPRWRGSHSTRGSRRVTVGCRGTHSNWKTPWPSRRRGRRSGRCSGRASGRRAGSGGAGLFSFLPTSHPRPAAPPTAPCAPGGRCARSHDRGHCLYFRSSLGECHTSCGTGGREYSRQAAPRPRNASRGPLRRDAPRLTGASGSGPTRCTGTRGPPSFGDCSRRTATC